MASSDPHRTAWGPTRAPVLRAAAEVFIEHGSIGGTVELVIKRARVSRRTFNREFTDLDDCMIAILDLTLAHTLALAADAFEGARHWREGMRGALLSILAFLDAEPTIANLVFFKSFAGGDAVLLHRKQVMDAFREAIVARIAAEVPESGPEADRTLFGAVREAIHDHLATRDPAPLVTLLGPLMARMLYQAGDSTSLAEEPARSRAAVDAHLAARSAGGQPRSPHQPPAFDWGASRSLDPLLADRRAKRLRQCLRFVAAHPGCSNTAVARGLGIAYSSQASEALGQLVKKGLLIKRSNGIGRANVWRLSPAGEEALHALDSFVPSTS